MAISRNLDRALERISGLFSGSTQFGFWDKIEDFKDEVKKIIKVEGVSIKEIPELIYILNNLKALDYDEYARAEYARSVSEIQEQASSSFLSQCSSMSDFYDNEVRAEHQGLLKDLNESSERKRMIDVERKRRIELIIEILEEIENG